MVRVDLGPKFEQILSPGGGGFGKNKELSGNLLFPLPEIMRFDAGEDLNTGGEAVAESGLGQAPCVRFFCSGGEKKDEVHVAGLRKKPRCFSEIGRASFSMAARRSVQTRRLSARSWLWRR